MKVKDFLKKIITIDDMIDLKANEVAKLRALLDVGAVRYDKDKVMGGSQDDKMLDTVVRIVELEDEINVDIDSLIAHKELARQMIESLDDDREKIILYKRYFEKKSFEQISVDTNYSWRQVHRLHGRALVALDNNFKDVIECHT